MQAYADVRVAVMPDDAVAGCTVTAARIARTGEAEGDAGPALGELACKLVGGSARFRHGLDDAGVARGATLAFKVRFTRTLAPNRPLPVVLAPPPPVLLVGNDGSPRGYIFSHGAWLPAAGATGISFDKPPFDTFRPAGAGMPIDLRVGASLTLERNAVIDCTIALSSGDADLDKATCAALASTRNNVSSHWPVAEPVLVIWRGRHARLVTPGIGETRPDLPAVTPLGAGGVEARAKPPKPLATMDFRIGGDGHLFRCRIDRSTGDDEFDARSCRLVAATLHATPGTDIFGQPLEGGITVTLDWDKRVIRTGW